MSKDISYGTILNQYNFPMASSQAQMGTIKGTVPWKFGVKQGIQLKKIRSSTAYFTKLNASSGTIQTSMGTLTQYVVDTGTISHSSFTNGTIANSIYSGTITQAISSSGTFTNPTTNTGTINTSLFQNGTVSGGTVNSTYQTGGTAGVSGSIIYVKTVSPGTTFGTLSFTNGIVTSFN